MKQITLATSLNAGLLVLSLVLTGCKQNDSKPKDDGKITVSNRQSSEELALAAEQLVGPYTFMLAYRTAVMAYEKDPSNLKAEFYMRFLKRMEAFRGLYYRITPTMKPQERVQFKEYVDKFLPNSPMRLFLLDESKPQLQKVTDYQDILSDYFQATVEFRQFLKNHQDARLELYMNPHVFEQQIREETTDNCQYVENPDGGFQFDCNQRQVASKKLNSADLIMLRQMASAEVLYSFFNSYSLSGIEQLETFDPNNLKSNKERAEFLATLPGFGKLRQDQTITMFKELGSDLYSAQKWVLQYQKELCPKGYSYKNQRRGFLFRDGICADNGTESQKTMALFERLLGGVTTIDAKTAAGYKVQMNINLFAWSATPIQDLRQIQPTAWNSCDHAVSFQDNTLGGVFVDNNVSVLLNSECKK